MKIKRLVCICLIFLYNICIKLHHQEHGISKGIVIYYNFVLNISKYIEYKSFQILKLNKNYNNNKQNRLLFNMLDNITFQTS